MERLYQIEREMRNIKKMMKTEPINENNQHFQTNEEIDQYHQSQFHQYLEPQNNWIPVSHKKLLKSNNFEVPVNTGPVNTDKDSNNRFNYLNFIDLKKDEVFKNYNNFNKNYNNQNYNCSGV